MAYQESIQQLYSCLNNSTDTSSADFEIGVKRKRGDEEDISLEVEPIPIKRS